MTIEFRTLPPILFTLRYHTCSSALAGAATEQRLRPHLRIQSFLVGLFILCLVLPAAKAEEGMWTLDNFPAQKVEAKYGFRPTWAWLDHVRAASVRVADGCSASFISPQGLAMTNHHCVIECAQQMSTAEQNLAETGFTAKTAIEEKKCPAFELDQLLQISDVTNEVHKVLAGKVGSAANHALHAIQAKLEESCGADPAVLCEVVPLYHGGIYDLYRYKRYTDVRLVFAPEFSVAQFGGDPDNFNFPRYDFDIGMLRAYEEDKPANTPDYLRWSTDGSKPGDLVFAPGDPGGTSRELTISQLEFLRDHVFPVILPFIAEYRGQLEQFVNRGPDQARIANDDVFMWANSFKAEFGEQAALLDAKFFASKVREERRLRAAVAASPKLAAYSSAWDEIAKIQRVREQLYARNHAVSTYLFKSGMLGNAIRLVRAASERSKPNGERLPGYTDQALISLRQKMLASIPVYRDFEELGMAYLFTIVRRDLGADDTFVRKLLGNESPEQLAHRLATESHLDDPKVREELYNGGMEAIRASNDPLIRFALNIDPDMRAVQKEYEDRIEAPTRAATAKIAKARFAVYGTSVYPDATFTLRISYGAVKGFENAEGKQVEPYTTIGGLFRRANGAPPYALPQRWLDAKSTLNLDTPMNLSTTNDIIGGNSGSPLINSKGEIVGLIFDGNIFSLGGEYGYDAAKNRAVSVDSRALLEGLRKVYHMDRVVDEIEAARR